MKALGIDLGTANTYFYGDTGENLPAPVIVDGLSDDAGSMATVVLYEKNQPILAGNIAEQEYYSQPGLQKHRRLASQFKPELALKDEEAMAAATDFLRLAREALPTGILTADTVITVGMPALAREDFKINLKQCFQNSGWPLPSFARESDAALVSALQSGSLSAPDMAHKCLIVDFGGGTCDYTTVEKLDVLQNGGDILYGGRLFDDLFFQTFCRENRDLASEAPNSPYVWHSHWLECKREKEKFSDFINKNPSADAGITLRIVWHDARGTKREAFLKDYTRDKFLADAENYTVSQDLLRILAPYARRGGLSAHARDLLEGRQTGLVSWLRTMLEEIRSRREVTRVVLTGGSSRWFFMADVASEIFPSAKIVASNRGYEDIAFGLALYPSLVESQKTATTLLTEQLPAFTAQAVGLANELVGRYARKVAKLCSERIAERDIMPVLEEARKESATAAELEEKFSTAIAGDKGLGEIVEASSEELRREVEHGLNHSFRQWLTKNGVPLVPAFDFPVMQIGREFFEGISVRVSRLDSLNLMAFTLRHILPLLAGTATAGVLIHSGEPVTSVLGGGTAFGLTWLMARTAPEMLKQRKLPSFILNERNRKRIVEKNQEYIERELLKSFEGLKMRLGADIELRLKESLTAMIGSLSALNQVRA